MPRLSGVLASLGLLVLIAAGCNHQQDPKLKSIQRMDGVPNPSGSGFVTNWSDLGDDTVMVVVRGSHFTSDTTITIEGESLLSTVVSGSTSLTGIAPPGTSLGPKRVDLRSRHGNDKIRQGWEYIGGNVTLLSVVPTAGDVLGGTLVTLTGTGFVPGMTVSFGSSSANPVNVLTVNTATVLSPPSVPAGTEQTVPVSVFTTVGSATLTPGYTYFTCSAAGTLVVTSVVPSTGPQSGGNSVTVTGADFTAATEISFGGIMASNYDYTGIPCAIVVDVPPGALPGAVDVEAKILGTPTLVAVLTAGYTYNSVSVTSIFPIAGPESGGTLVTITGSAFDPASTEVLFKDLSSGQEASAVNVMVSGGLDMITCNTPLAPGGPGFVNVEVRNANGSDTLINGFQYLPVSLDSIEPNFGPLGGGVGVVIMARGLTVSSTPTVWFGSNRLTSAVAGTADPVTGELTISGRVPVGDAPGPVDVTIEDNIFGDITLSDGFVYAPGAPEIRNIIRNFGRRSYQDAAGNSLAEIVTIEGDNFTTAPFLVQITFDTSTTTGDSVPDNLVATVTRIVSTRILLVEIPDKANDGLNNREVVEVTASNSIGSTATPDAFAYAEWESPGPLGGFVTGIVVDPVDSNVVYVGIDGAGAGETGAVFRTDNAGGSWASKAIPDPLDPTLKLDVNAIAVAPQTVSSAQTLYAGTPVGLYLSVDRGENWLLATHPDLSTPVNPILSLAVDTGTVPPTLFVGSDGVVFQAAFDGSTSTAFVVGTGTREVPGLAVASTGEVYAGTMGEGVFRQATSGAAFLAFGSNLTNLFVLSVEVDPLLPTRVFAGTFGDGVFWFDNNTGMWTAPVSMPSSVPAAYDVKADPGSSGRIYTVVDDVGGATRQGAVWRSDDGGRNWIDESLGLALSGAEPEMRSLGIVSQVPSPTNIIYSGALGAIFKTTNANSPPINWNKTDVGVSNTNVRALVRSSGGDTFAGTLGYGVYRSADSGLSWTIANGTPPNSMTSRRVQALAAFDDGLGTVFLYAGTADRGVFRSNDLGLTWYQTNSGLDVTSLDEMNITSIAFAPGMERVVYIGTDGAGVFGTCDPSSDDPITMRPPNCSASDAIDPLNPPNVNWFSMPGAPPDGVLGFSQIRTVYITPEIIRFRPLAVDPFPPTVPFPIRLVLVGTASGGLFASDTNGVKWKDVSAGLPDLDLRSIDTALQVITDPQEPTRTTLNFIMFAGTGAGGMARGTTDINILSDPLDPSMFKTQILGIVWSAVNTGLPQGGTGLAVNAVAIDPSVTSNVFIGTEFDGVFMTGSGGSLWSALDPGSPLTSPVGDNLTNPRVDDIGLVFNTCADCTTILAGTAGGGANRIEILKQ